MRALIGGAAEVGAFEDKGSWLPDICSIQYPLSLRSDHSLDPLIPAFYCEHGALLINAADGLRS